MLLTGELLVFLTHQIINIGTNMLKEIEHIMQAQSTEEVKGVLETIIGNYQIPYFLYGIRIPQMNKQAKDLVLNIYPNGWMEHYYKENYIEVDSVLHYCFSNNLPIVWSDDLFSNSSKMREESKDAGMQFGASFPIHSATGEKGIFSIASAKEKDISTYIFMLISTLLPYIHEKIKELEKQKLYPKLPLLTDREKDVLAWTAIGKTAFEVSCILNIAEATVVFHLKAATKKLNCKSKGQAVALALIHKMILV